MAQFLANHLSVLASVDFFVVDTITFELLYVFIIVFIILVHERRRIVHVRRSATARNVSASRSSVSETSRG